MLVHKRRHIIVNKLTPLELEKQKHSKIDDINIKCKKEIKELKKELDEIDSLKYIKFMLIPGIVAAIIAFLNIGAWFDEKYGFDGSAGVAFAVAIAVLIGFVVLGIVFAALARLSKKNEIYRKESYYTQECKKIEDFYNNEITQQNHQANSMTTKFSNNSHIVSVIKTQTEYFLEKIKNENRSNYIKNIRIQHKIDVSATWICNLNLVKERLDSLNTYAEKMAVSKVISEKIRENLLSMLNEDISGTPYDISIKYTENTDTHTVSAFLEYSCLNGFYEETKPW